jgi:PAS domain S-box-containing protein
MAEVLSDMVHASQVTILHVEDDLASRYAIGRILHHEGFTLREAATGAEGLRLVKERPDLVILDVQLPDLNGFEICRRIKADPATAMVPVLHLSASYVTDKDQVTGLEGGADGYLVQPVDPGVLVATVRALLRMRRAEETLRESSRRIENILESFTDAFVAVDREWRYTYINERALRRMQWRKGDEELTREEVLGKNMWEMFPDIVGTTIYHKYQEAMREQKTVEFETYFSPSDEWIEAHAYPSEEGLAIYYRDVTERKRAQKEIETRTHQQAVVAELGLRAQTETNLQFLMDEAVTLVARTLEVEYCKIVELLPNGEKLLLRAGVGWKEGLLGTATEEAGLDSQADYTLRLEEPVIVEDVGTETRFRPSWLLPEHGVVSTVTVVIHGRDRAFGVLGAHTKSHRTFSEDDVNFLQAVANVLATAIEHEEAEKKLYEVREAERSRMARDLHDEALQDLSHALVEAQRVRSDSKDPRPVQRMEGLIAALDRVGQQLRSAVYDLRLGGEQDRPFSELLESRVELQRAMAPECEIRLEIKDGVLSGPIGETGREVLRIVGEALTNARRHSRARNIRVKVWTSEDKKLFAEVSDDGQGFDPAQEPSATTTGGMGMKGMRERARALGAVLKIGSEPEAGTKVRFELALEKEREQPEKEVRVLLVEDHASLREAVASVFAWEAGFEVVRQAGSLAEARRMLEGVDVAVIDLALPDGYGGDLIRELREANPQAQALVLSASLDRVEIARAVERGAAGVLHKTAHLDEVVEAVRGLRAGETLMPLEEVVELMRFAGTQREQEYEARQAIEKLTAREREVLQALAEGLDGEGIAEQLHISLRTERNHMSNILAKLGVHSQLQALVFALRYGVVNID